MKQLSPAEMELGLGMVKALDRTPDSELRILMFTATYFVLDGVTLTIRRLESHLRAAGAQVKVVTTVPEDVDPEQLTNVIRVPGIKIPWDGGYAFGTNLDDQTRKEIEDYNPNCVHFTVPDFVALDAIRWCQKNNVAYMATWHSNYVDYMKFYLIDWIIGAPMQRYMKGFYEQIPAVYVPTPYMENKMRSEGFGRFSEMYQWGRGCDLKIFRPDRRSEEFRQSKGIEENDVAIIWVGRLVPEKRPDIWMDVVKRLQSEGHPVKPLIVGHGAFMERSLQDIKDLTCCGWLSGIALAEAYASSDILLFPSGVETFGNVTLEAQASGCVSIVESKCSGHLVESGENGFCCPDGDYEAYYQATRTLVVETALRKKMSVVARESAWKFERSKIMQQMAENYKDAIVRHRDPTFIKRHLAQSAEVQGNNVLAFLCGGCVGGDYCIVKAIAEPFLKSSVGAQNVYYGAQECVTSTRSRMSCGSLANMDYSSLENKPLNPGEEAEMVEQAGHEIYDVNSQNKNGEGKLGLIAGLTQKASNIFFSRGMQLITTIVSYMIIAFLVYSSFNVMGVGGSSSIKQGRFR